MATIETAVEIRPFHVEVPEEELADLRRRIAATRWPEKETVADETQGVQLATMQELVRYWKGGFFNAKGVSIPVAVTVFPGEQYQAPRSWAEQAYPNLIYSTKSTRAANSPPGSSRSSSPRSSARRSAHCVSKGGRHE